MTDDLQELDGVGPSREDDLNEAGYESYEDVAEADHEELEEDIPRLSEDKALDLVVQAQNLVDLQETEVAESDSDDADDVSDEEGAEDSEDEETAEEVAEDDSDETEAEPEPEPEDVPFAIGFEGSLEYDAFFNAVYDARRNLYRTNRGEQAETYNTLLDGMRGTDAEGTVEVELTADGLNNLHNELRNSIVDSDVQDEADALRRLEIRVNDVRQEYLF